MCPNRAYHVTLLWAEINQWNECNTSAGRICAPSAGGWHGPRNVSPPQTPTCSGEIGIIFRARLVQLTSSSSRSPGPGWLPCSPHLWDSLCGIWWVTDLSGLQFRDQESKRLRSAEGFEHCFSDPRLPWRIWQTSAITHSPLCAPAWTPPFSPLSPVSRKSAFRSCVWRTPGVDNLHGTSQL